MCDSWPVMSHGVPSMLLAELTICWEAIPIARTRS
jgi:hypothetical protein